MFAVLGRVLRTVTKKAGGVLLDAVAVLVGLALLAVVPSVIEPVMGIPLELAVGTFDSAGLGSMSGLGFDIVVLLEATLVPASATALVAAFVLWCGSLVGQPARHVVALTCISGLLALVLILLVRRDVSTLFLTSDVIAPLCGLAAALAGASSAWRPEGARSKSGGQATACRLGRWTD